ncbi:MAG: glutamate dehydrogenase, partial [Phycisphaeraceae bacterium]|nr:glutamate dehydrogenase [Phycisphaeraceae bacterium]
PAALANQITTDNVDDVKASFIVECANGPVAADADEALRDKGVTIVPDILANAGGVTVSYFEWIQNRQGDYWDKSTVHDRLEQQMNNAFDAVRQLADEHDIDLRTAAYAVALNRVGAAIEAQGTRAYFAAGD